MASYSWVFAVVVLFPLVAGVALAAPAPLYALWSDLNGSRLNITTVDPTTGAQGPVLYTSTEWVTLFPVTPAVDHQGKRLFYPLIDESKQVMLLGVFDMSKVGAGVVTLEKTVPFVGSYVFGLHYDPVGDQVWIIATDLHKRASSIYIELVNLSSSTSKSVATLPGGVIPAVSGMGGAPTAFDQKTRALVLPTRTTDSSHYYWSVLDVKSYQWSNTTLDKISPVALYWDDQTAASYALFQSIKGSPLSFGTIDSRSGKMKVINQWKVTSLDFVVGSLVAYDTTSAQLYSLIGSGNGPPVALVSASTTSGQLEHYSYFQTNQPSGLFCL